MASCGKNLNLLYFYREMYQDYITQYKEVLKQHCEKYAETALAQEYYKKRKEVEEIQSRILKHCEKYKWKEDACLDRLGTTFINAFMVEPTGSALCVKSAVQESSG